MSKNQNTQDPDERGDTLLFLKVIIFKPPWLRPEPMDISILNRLPIAYADQIWPSHMWSCSVSSTQLERVSRAVLCHGHTHNLYPPTGQPSAHDNRCLQVDFGSNLAATISMCWRTHYSHNHSTNHSILLKCFYAKSSQLLKKKKKHLPKSLSMNKYPSTVHWPHSQSPWKLSQTGEDNFITEYTQCYH